MWIVFLLVIVIILFSYTKKFLEPVDIYSISIHESFGNVWKIFSDPLHYAELYPNWIESISKITVNIYKVDDQFGNSYEMTLLASEEFGSIDLKIGKEVSSLRLFPLNENQTLAMHVAKPWKGINWIKWYFHKRTIAKDFKNAKKVIESKNRFLKKWQH